MKKLRFFSAIALTVMVSCEEAGILPPDQIDEVITESTVVATLAPTEVTGGTAVLNGFTDLKAAEGYDTFGFIVSMDPNPTLANGWVPTGRNPMAPGDDNRISLKLTELMTGTKYYYKTFIKTGNILQVGEVKSFTTNDKYFVTFKELTPRIINSSVYQLFIAVESDVTPWLLTHSFPDNYAWGIYYSTTASTRESLVKDGTFYKPVRQFYNSDGEISETYDYSSYYDQETMDIIGWRYVGLIEDMQPASTYYVLPYVRIGSHEYFGDIQSFSTPRIITDGNFADWDKLDASKVAQAVCANGATFTALRKIKACADKDFVYVYLEWDPDRVDFNNYFYNCGICINSDNNTATGGCDFWRDRCIDILFESDIYPYNYYSLSPYRWAGGTNGGGWHWEYLDNSSNEYATACGDQTRFEVCIPRVLSDQVGKISDSFSVGVYLTKEWDTYGLLPNTYSTDSTPAATMPVKAEL